MEIVGRERRKLRIRKKVSGTPERPRLTVFRSAKHIYAQVIDDSQGRTLAHASTLTETLRALEGNKSDAAKAVGAKIAELCKANNIEKVVFDRNGYRYHGRISALAQGARDAGLQF
jgi:large subunit ribosomal protein L18